MNADDLSPPSSHPSFGDVAHALTVKAALSSIPLAGPFLSEAMQLIVASPAQKRMKAFLLAVAERIATLEAHGVSPDALANDEGFQDVIAAAIDAGRRSASSEKRTRLLSCIESSAKLDTEADKQRFYIQCVDGLTNGHFALLARFCSREFHPARFGSLTDEATRDEMLVRLGWPGDEGGYLDALLLDLAARGLITNRGRAGTSLASKNFQKMEITGTGAGLIAFAQEPT
jgi:hypothetical protein